MERESFECEETAALMNALFVNVKVDREERPDVDRVRRRDAGARGQGTGRRAGRQGTCLAGVGPGPGRRPPTQTLGSRRRLQ